MGNKLFGIGIDDFQKMIDSKSFYIDKTKFIEEILQNNSSAKLFTRPRRFGKSLNMSMLKYFFDVENAKENRKLFSGLYIESSPYMEEQGKYPVIHISFKDVKEKTWEESLVQLKIEISKLFKQYENIIDVLSEFDRSVFQKYREQSVNSIELKNALSFLVDCLKEIYNKDVILLIDEYDACIIHAYHHGFYEDAISFFKGLYGSVLKGNSNVKFGVMTGIVRLAQAGIFSDLNNLDVYTILRTDYDEFFGFTEDEVKSALKEYELSDCFEKVKYWYDGYRFGESEIYNPWSIINYLKDKVLKEYWVNTSENKAIVEVLKHSTPSTIEMLTSLLEGKETFGTITESVTFSGNLREHEIWEFLFFAGYLRVVSQLSHNIYSFKIPNHEIELIFKTLFDEVFESLPIDFSEK